MSNLSQNDVSVFQKSDLSKFMGRTLQNCTEAEKAVSKELDVQIKTNSFAIPTLQYYLNDMCPNLRGLLGNLYVTTMQEVAAKGWENVDSKVQQTQAALFDGVLFVYDSQKDTYCLATMNLKLLDKLGAKSASWSSIVKDNVDGYVRAYRIDVGYANNEISYKAVQARDFKIDDAKPDGQEDKRFTLVPYYFVERLIQLVAAQLEKGFLLQVAQTVGGMKKIRFITTNGEILKTYCDDPSAVVTDSRYFTDLGFFYAPSVGASSLTSMVTNINVFDIDAISLFKDGSILQTKGITKPASPIRDLVGEGLVCGQLAQYVQSGDARFEAVCQSLSYAGRLIKDAEKISVASISRYLHSVPTASKEKAYALCGVKGKVDELEAFFSGMNRRPLEDGEDIKSLLKTGVLRVVIQKDKDCKLSAVFCTNNREILAKVYGNNYVKRFESFSSCFYGFISWAKDEEYLSRDRVANHLNSYGLVADDEAVMKVLGWLGEKKEGWEDTIKGYLADRMGIDVKRSTASSNAQTNSIMVRTLTAFLDYDNKPYDYYRYVDPSKIVRGTVFEMK